jgi:hypothetical protein
MGTFDSIEIIGMPPQSGFRCWCGYDKPDQQAASLTWSWIGRLLSVER